MRERWRALGIPGAIDIHTHFMPANVMAKVWAYFDRIEADFGQAWPITYRFDNDRCAEILEGFGLVAHTALNYPHRPDMATWLNAWGADFADADLTSARLQSLRSRDRALNLDRARNLDRAFLD